MRFGVREIANVTLRARAHMFLGKKEFFKNEPVLYFDTLKTSSLEGASTTVYAQGGQGNARLVAWAGDKTMTWTMEDALISPESLTILAGAELIDAAADTPLYVHTTSQVEIEEDYTIVLPELACWSKYTDTTNEYYKDGADIFIMHLDDNGLMDAEPCRPADGDSSVVQDATAGTTTITCYGHDEHLMTKGTIVRVDYYVKKTGNAQQIDITTEDLSGNYYLEGDTLFRDEASGVDMPAVFTIPNGKIQSNFTFSMASTGDPSTFSFTIDAFPAYTKFDKTKKVLASIQIITDEVDASEADREPCVEPSTNP